MMELGTTWLGLPLKHPLIASASPLTGSVEAIRRVADAGASAVVLESLFEEQIDLEAMALDDLYHVGADSFAEVSSYFPETSRVYHRPEEYLDLVADARKAVDIPVIASLNGRTRGGWLDYAGKLEKAGAHALELNLYQLPHDARISGAEIERNYVEVVRTVKQAVRIPVAVKLSPFFTAPAHFLRQMAVEGGADGLVLFNRFYQPDFDPETLEIVPHLELSRSAEVRLPMTWIALLYGRVPADFGLTGGVANAQDAIKALLAGARVVAMASELLRHGPERIGQIVAEIQQWLVEKEYRSLFELIGSLSQKKAADPSALMRANYMKVLHSWRG
jgi:dihydroorotate dehydrogenase (fumarate)